MTPTLDPIFADALRRDLIDHVRRPAHRRRRIGVIGGAAALTAAAAFGGMTAATGRAVADPPLGDPILLNGVGSATVVLPDAPADATYLRVELVCWEATTCATPGGSVDNEQRSTLWQRDALPLTGLPDPSNVQVLDPLDPAVGLPITTNPHAHWRLYATYTDRLNPRSIQLEDGRRLGLPSNDVPPALVPVVADNGRTGYVDSELLLDGAPVRLTSDGTSQDPLPVYDDNGHAVIGEVTVDTPYEPAS